MARPPLHVDVSKKDQEELRKVTKGGVQQVRVVLRALALLQLAEQTGAPQIARVVPLTPQAIRRLGHRYQQAGLDGALYENPRCQRSIEHQPETAHHRNGLQRSAGRASAVERSAPG